MRVGIVGSSGRMGRALGEMIVSQDGWELGKGFSRSDGGDLETVFQDSQYVVDVSHHGLLGSLLKAGRLSKPTPLVLCSTGWSWDEHSPQVQELAQRAPVFVAPNTSQGAFLQKKLVSLLSQSLGEDYDIDIFERHHRHKKDHPSGTARELLKGIQKSKTDHWGVDYESFPLGEGSRPPRWIGVQWERTGETPGDHRVAFESPQEVIEVCHRVWDRKVFVLGILRILHWLEQKKPGPGVYTMDDIFCFANI